MQFQKVNRNEIPPGAKILTKSEVLDQYWKLLTDWEPYHEVSFFHIGYPALTGASAIANLTMLNSYRTRLKLGRRGFLLMALTCGCLPAMAAPILHGFRITNKLILGELCTVCADVNAVAYQLTTAFAYSLTITPTLAFLKAQSLGTFNVPSFGTTEGRLRIWQLYKKFTKRASKIIYWNIVFNSVVATMVTVTEIKELKKVNEKLFERDNQTKSLQKSLADL